MHVINLLHCWFTQGTLKEKTVENLEKYVVKDVSLSFKLLICLFVLQFLQGKCNSKKKLFFSFKGKVAIAAEPHDWSRKSFLSHQQWLQIHRSEFTNANTFISSLSEPSELPCCIQTTQQHAIYKHAIYLWQHAIYKERFGMLYIGSFM